MAKVGVITLGLNPQGDYLAEFLENLKSVSSMDISVFDYKSLDPTQIAKSSIDVLVLSPGDALVGLDTVDRKKRDPGISPLYDLIRESVINGIPLLGINAGHLALNCAYDLPIDKIPEGYSGMHEFDLTSVSDPIVRGINTLPVNLTNGYAVLPKDKTSQDMVIQLVDHLDRPLISRIESEAPVYGVQFNIQPGTEKIFRNFFQFTS